MERPLKKVENHVHLLIFKNPALKYYLIRDFMLLLFEMGLQL
jgi:hypothetical protein